MRMLIVDDVMTNCAVLKRMAMRVFGGEIDIETCSMAAIKACHERTYDIIITDYMMPALDGIGMVSVLRCFDEYKRTPIIMTSACADPAVLIRSMRHGVDDYILKPINADQFRSKITHHLSLRPNAYAA
ncbi:MAG: response regulator [Rhizobiaceae bacterium]|jgi:PleD family two-component response regulator